MCDWYENFCYNIDYLRKLHGLTRREMADILGISTQTLRRMENRIPTVRVYSRMICRLCGHFIISADTVLRTRLE